MSINLDRRALLTGAAGLFVAGCSNVIGPPPVTKLYVLKPNLPGPLPGEKVDWALSVQLPTATAGLDSEHIAILRPPAALDYYAETSWSDPLPSLVQSATIQAFEACGRIAAVSRDSDGAQSDYVLGADLRDFEARYDQGEGAPLAVVRLGIRLVETRSRKVAGYTEIAKQARASANSIDAAVEAMTQAFAGVQSDLVPWVLNHPKPA